MSDSPTKADLASKIIGTNKLTIVMGIVGVTFLVGFAAWGKIEGGLVTAAMTLLGNVIGQAQGSNASMLASTRPADAPQPVTVTNPPSDPIPTEETHP